MMKIKQVLGQIIPSIMAFSANCEIHKKKDKINIPNNISEESFAELSNDYNESLNSKNRFEDKAKTILASLTIAITLVLNLSTLIDRIINKVPYEWQKGFVFALAVLSIVYMLSAGLLSIKVLIKENIVFNISLEDRTNKNKTAFYEATQCNIYQNLIRNNIMYAAYLSIRNSVICLMILFYCSICPY